MTGERLRARLRELLPAMLERLEEMVCHESPSDDKPALDALARGLAERFSSLGAEAALLAQATAGDHLRVMVPAPPPASGEPPALILAHFDTVWPRGSLAEHPFRVEGDRASGPGSFDMKAGIVALEFALRALREEEVPLPRPVVVLLNSDEELGSPTSRPLIEAEARRAAYALVLEPPLSGGALKTARRGVGRFVVEVQGRAAHAGVEPEKGVSAIEELAHLVLRLHALADPRRGTAVNVGVVAGGTRPNVVAARAHAQVDVRAATVAEAQRVEEVIRSLQPVNPAARLLVSGGFTRPPMEFTPASAALFQRARELARECGLELEHGSSGGGSDGNFTAALGAPTLDGLGPDGAGAHADHEHVLVESMAERAALLAVLLAGL